MFKITSRLGGEKKVLGYKTIEFKKKPSPDVDRVDFCGDEKEWAKS